MTIDKSKLKSLAEAATQSHGARRVEVDHNGVHVIGDGSWKILSAWHTPDGKGAQNAEFAAVASPATVLALLGEIKRLTTSRSKKERDLEQELEVWRNGPSCWTCGDTGDVHDITGEWRGECDCLAAQLINANRERDQLKADSEALRKDAERYRWLRDGEHLHRWVDLHVCDEPRRAELTDRAIDAAMTMEVSHG